MEPAEHRLQSLVARLRAALRAPAGSPRPGHDPRLNELRTRIERLESVVEGLQDALYRESRRLEERIAEVRARTEPAEIARALSDDARRRGL